MQAKLPRVQAQRLSIGKIGPPIKCAPIILCLWYVKLGHKRTIILKDETNRAENERVRGKKYVQYND